jgi:hypothetical protein
VYLLDGIAEYISKNLSDPKIMEINKIIEDSNEDEYSGNKYR